MSQTFLPRSARPVLLATVSAVCLITLAASLSPAQAGFIWTKPAESPAAPATELAKPTPVEIAPIQPAAPAPQLQKDIATKNIVEGFGRDLPLVVALRQITPSNYQFGFADGVRMDEPTSWTGGIGWQELLDQTLKSKNLMARIDGQMITISPGANYAAASTPPAMPMPPAPMPVAAAAPLTLKPAPVAPVAVTPAPVLDTSLNEKLDAAAKAADRAAAAAEKAAQTPAPATPVAVTAANDPALLAKIEAATTAANRAASAATAAANRPTPAPVAPAPIVAVTDPALLARLDAATAAANRAAEAAEKAAQTSSAPAAAVIPATPAPAPSAPVQTLVAPAPVAPAPVIAAPAVTPAPAPAPASAPAASEEETTASLNTAQLNSLPPTVKPLVAPTHLATAPAAPTEPSAPPPLPTRTIAAPKLSGSVGPAPALAVAMDNGNDGQLAQAANTAWIVEKNRTLREILENWAETAGWTVVWDSQRDWMIESSASFTGDFQNAAGDLIKAFAQAKPPVVGTFYKNRTLVIEAQSNGETN